MIARRVVVGAPAVDGTNLKLTAQGQSFSHKPCATYVPKKISEHPDAKSSNTKAMAAAMQRLLDAGILRIGTEGPPSKRRTVLQLAPSN